jgi:hypothetical protein
LPSQLTQVGTLRAVNVKGQVTFLVHGAEIIEDHAVGTQFLCYGAVNTFVVLVALIRVREVPVRFWALVGRVVRLCRWTLRGRRWASRCLLLATGCLATYDACNKKTYIGVSLTFTSLQPTQFY